MPRISGGCACRAVRYETDAEPAPMINCHCRDCQRSTGGGFGAFAVFPKTAVRVQGEPRYYKTVGNSGGSIDRGFCANCGSPVVVTLERMPDVVGVLAASLDDPSLYKPAMDIFTDSAWAWDLLHPDTKKMPQGMM